MLDHFRYFVQIHPKGWLHLLGLTLLLGFCPAAYSASKTLLVLGDSISAEYGLPRDSGWVALLRQRCQQQNLKLEIINASISGDTTSGGRARLPALLKQHQPAWVIIELGGNDGLRGLPVAETEANLLAMTRAAQQAKAQVLLLGMRMPPNYGRSYTEQFFASFGKVAKQQNAALLPFFLEKVADDITLFQSDRIHPNQKAQAILLDNVWPHLQPLISGKKPAGKQVR
ncbi:MAG: hypothetical protein RL748_335 [Pseudomonadota bacterium]